jgi:sulfite dehydrogenase (quinone) subunit SoeB
MKKCTLCVDRIYNTNLEPEDQVPACVKACPTGARHFGDLGDASSIVAVMVSERGGYDLLPQLGYKPTNKYLPPRERRNTAQPHIEKLPKSDGSTMEKLFLWADKLLSKKSASATANPADNSGKLEG